MAKASIEPFRNLTEFIEFYDEKVLQTTGRYRTLIEENKADADRSLARGVTNDNLQTYGEPVPASYDDAMDRRMFLNMVLYQDKYEELKPTLQSLEQLSNSIIPKPILMPNDRELGTFSLERAMMALEAELGLHDEKKDEWYSLSDGVAILEKNGKPKTNAEGYNLFYLKDTKTILVLKEYEKDGEKQWGSKNKKVFVALEKLPRPKRAIRMFILVGANWGSDTFWGGLTGIIAAQFLEAKGYAIRITGVFGINRHSGLNFKNDGTFENGYRFNFIDLKLYDEPLNSLSLLYLTADPSFFRTRIFSYWYAEQHYRGDEPYSSLGSMPSIDALRGSILTKIKEKEFEEEKDTLYYYFGGTEVTNFAAAEAQLIEMVCDAENANREMLISMGYSFPPIDTSIPKKVGDIDCPPPRQPQTP
jgi:hypothetical protein